LVDYKTQFVIIYCKF